MSRYASLVKPELLTQPVYQPGKPIEEVARELGLDPAGILKLASNENPLGPSPKALEAARRALESVRLYPDGGCYALKRALAAKFGLEPGQFIVGNGSNEVLELVGHAFIGPGDEAVMSEGAFIVYKLVTLLFGGKVVETPMLDYRHDLKAMAAAATPRTKVVFVASPNNPTGTANGEDQLLELLDALPGGALLVLDEAYSEYLDNPPDLRPAMAQGKRVLCARTFSKIHGLAGLRIGYGYGDPELIALLDRAREPFNVNAVAQAAALAALEDEAHVQRCRRLNAEGRAQLEAGLEALGVPRIPSLANFVTAQVDDGEAAFACLQRRGVIARPLGPYGMGRWLRLSVGLPEDNRRALEALGSYLQTTGGARHG